MNNNYITFTAKQQITLLKLTKTIALDNELSRLTKNGDFTIDCAQLLNHGLVFLDKEGMPMSKVPDYIARAAIDNYGYNNEDFNRTLIESFATVDRMTAEKFYTIQILHYLTTYGTNFTTPFIVGERTFTPEETKALKITIIRAESAERSLERVNDLFANTAAPKAQYQVEYHVLAPLTTIAPEEVKSNELMVAVCKARGIRPENPMALFRFLIYCATGETLIIKNRELIKCIKESMHYKTETVKLITSLTENEQARLATIFYRYKPLFLAFKISATAHVINRIRRLAVKYHRPESALTLKNFTAIAINGNYEEVGNLIARANNRELIKLYNAAAFKAFAKTHMYQIRNGKIWYEAEPAKKLPSSNYINLFAAMDAIRNELINRLENYKGMTIYIPRGINYAVPYSEKQFSGVIPWGTVITADRQSHAFTAGVHWVNDPDERHCDLDLFAHTPTTYFGWNGSYINNGEIVYSGDMVDAPAEKGGATESFYINNVNEPVILTLNAYSAKPNKQFQFFVTEGKNEELKEGCAFDATKLIGAPLPLAFVGTQALSLGIFHEKQFYVYGGNLNKGSVPTGNYPKVIEALLNRLPNMYSLHLLATDLGMNIVEDAPVDTPFIDLRPEALTVTTLLDFVDGKGADLLREPLHESVEKES